VAWVALQAAEQHHAAIVGHWGNERGGEGQAAVRGV
jgi:hypothetical protein